MYSVVFCCAKREEALKKFIIAICGMFLICVAYATVDVVQPEIQTAWTFSGDNPKNSVKDKYSVKKNNKYDFVWIRNHIIFLN